MATDHQKKDGRDGGCWIPECVNIHTYFGLDMLLLIWSVYSGDMRLCHTLLCHVHICKCLGCIHINLNWSLFVHCSNRPILIFHCHECVAHPANLLKFIYRVLHHCMHVYVCNEDRSCLALELHRIFFQNCISLAAFLEMSWVSI